MRATCEISFEYAGKPPVAKPTTRPEATIEGKLRHGRNTGARDGHPRKRLPPQRLARAAPTIAKTTASFFGIGIRSAIQSPRTRIATTGYARLRGPTTALGRKPRARS